MNTRSRQTLTTLTNKLYADGLYRGHYIPGAGRIYQLSLANLTHLSQALRSVPTQLPNRPPRLPSRHVVTLSNAADHDDLSHPHID